MSSTSDAEPWGDVIDLESGRWIRHARPNEEILFAPRRRDLFLLPNGELEVDPDRSIVDHSPFHQPVKLVRRAGLSDVDLRALRKRERDATRPEEVARRAEYERMLMNGWRRHEESKQRLVAVGLVVAFVVICLIAYSMSQSGQQACDGCEYPDTCYGRGGGFDC